jgi:uncharacterized protein YggE
MSIEHLEFQALVGDVIAANVEAVADAIRQVEHDHPGYRHSNPTEIRCSGWACGRFMDIKVGAGHNDAGAIAFAAHRAERVDALLAEWFPAPEGEDLGN